MGISEEKEYSTKVSVILVLRDCPPDISYCIDSLVYQTLEEMELLLVGNANDKSVAELVTTIPKYRPESGSVPYPKTGRTGPALWLVPGFRRICAFCRRGYRVTVPRLCANA